MYTFKITQHIRIYSYIPESLNWGSNRHEGIFLDTKNQELIKIYTQRIAQVLQESPDSETAIQKTLAQMSESIIWDPKNMTRLLEKISDITTADSKSKTNLMLLLMEKHGWLLWDRVLSAKVSELRSHMQSENVHIRAQASLGTHTLRSALG